MSDKENASQGGGKAPDGSWLQHVHEDRYLCWRSNLTHECTREIWYTPWESFASPAHRHLVPASFTSMTKGSKAQQPHRRVRQRDPVRAAGVALVTHPTEPHTRAFRSGLQSATGTENQKTQGAQGLPHPWEEIYHPVDGSKYWRHRETKEVRHKDPLY